MWLSYIILSMWVRTIGNEYLTWDVVNGRLGVQIPHGYLFNQKKSYIILWKVGYLKKNDVKIEYLNYTNLFI